MFRRLRVVIAGSLLGALALVGAVGPEASAAPGDWARADIHIDSFLHDGTSAFNIDCSFSMRLAADFGGPDATLYQAGGGRCLLGPDTTPGLCSVGEVDCTTVETWVEGTGCDDIVHLFPEVGSDESDNTLHSAFSMGGYQVTDYAGGCDPESACIKISGPAALNPFSTMTYEGCGSIALEPFVEEVNACEHGIMNGAETMPQPALEQNGGEWYQHVFFRRTNVGVIGSQSDGTWISYVVWDKVTEPVAGVPGTGVPAVDFTNPVTFNTLVDNSVTSPTTALGFGHLGVFVNAHSGSATMLIHEGFEQDPGLTGYTAEHQVPLGAGMFYLEDWYDANPLNLWSLPGTNDTTTAKGVVGVHDPSRCAFYFGAKLWNNETLETDEPGGGLDEEILPPEDPDDPPPLPPTDDDGGCSGLECLSGLLGWLKAIWDRLGGILNQIIGLPGKIATAILDGVTALFVPEDGFLDDLFGDIEEEWRESAPGAFVTGFSELGVDFPASGCGGIPVEFATQGVHVDFALGEACSGAAASAASTVKLVAGASLVLFGGLACVRAIGAGFGWSPGVGKGGES